MQYNWVTDFESGNSLSYGVNPSGIFVTDGVWELDARLFFPLSFEDMNVGPDVPISISCNLC